jgi:hypothetical protein
MAGWRGSRTSSHRKAASCRSSAAVERDEGACVMFVARRPMLDYVLPHPRRELDLVCGWPSDDLFRFHLSHSTTSPSCIPLHFYALPRLFMSSASMPQWLICCMPFRHDQMPHHCLPVCCHSCRKHRRSYSSNPLTSNRPSSYRNIHHASCNFTPKLCFSLTASAKPRSAALPPSVFAATAASRSFLSSLPPPPTNRCACEQQLCTRVRVCVSDSLHYSCPCHPDLLAPPSVDSLLDLKAPHALGSLALWVACTYAIDCR